MKRIAHVLEYLPPGAAVPDERQRGQRDSSNEDDDSSEDDSDDDDNDCIVKPPGPIDNSALLVDPSDRFHRQWYRTAHEANDQPELKRNLVRGNNFELVHREVYNALRSWYGEATPSVCRRTTDDNVVVLYPLTRPTPSKPMATSSESGRYKLDLNTLNPIGAGGELASAYDNVMTDLWMKPGIRSSSPVSLKRAISKFAPRFAGCLQHDASEFLAFLLDGLHEDLNRIRKAPYVEMADVSNGQNMSIAAAEAWDAHKRRNDSLVMDTFYGQFQSTCVCPNCERVSVSFDTFNHVSLEIPQAVQSVPIAVPVLIYFADGRRPVKVGVALPGQAPAHELKSRVSDLARVLTSNLIFTGVCNSSIYTLLDDKRQVSTLDTSQDLIVAYEADPINKRGILHAIVSHCIMEGVESGNNMETDETEMVDDTNEGHTERKCVGIPFILSLPSGSSCRDVHRSLWKRVRRMVAGSSQSLPSAEDLDSNGCCMLQDVLTVRVVDSQGNYRAICEKDEEGAKTSILPQSATALSEILGQEGLDEYLFLSLEWKSSSLDLRKLDEVEEHHSLEKAFRIEQEQARESQRGVALDQCFQSFSRPERLDENNKWYCSACKDHVRALKTMKLWRLPNILVIHLKRFEYGHGFRREKLDTYVDFPFEGLDMAPYCPSASDDKAFVDDTVPAEYDLFAVVNHYGRMGFGHYTAFATQWDETGMSGEWDEFDDSRVERVDRSNARTPAAYVLFYRRRQFN
ncbi:MAG: hypothetical protein SGILL_006174 [Bacillariaceae sp.]